MKLVNVRAINCPDNVVEVDQSSAGAMVARGTWELVPETEEVTGDAGSKPARRRRAPRPPAAT